MKVITVHAGGMRSFDGHGPCRRRANILRLDEKAAPTGHRDVFPVGQPLGENLSRDHERCFC